MKELFDNPEKLQQVVIISAIVGLLVAIILIIVLVKQMKNVKYQNSAENYIKTNGFNLKCSNDIFLYSNVTKTPINTESRGNR